jgi:ABC-2 type transport system ATP-binding protein
MSENGATVVLSTHVLPQVDELCTDICLINRARAILGGSLSDIRARYGGNVWRINTEVPSNRIAELPAVQSVRPLRNDVLVELAPGERPRELMRALLGLGAVEAFVRFQPDLENIFIRAVEEDRVHVG